jgi:hypothetical protein
MSYKREQLLTEPRGGGTARDGVGFPMATMPSLQKKKKKKRTNLDEFFLDGFKNHLELNF